MRMVKRACVLLFCLSLFFVSGVLAFDFSKLEGSVTEFTLENGLKFFVIREFLGQVHKAQTMPTRLE